MKESIQEPLGLLCNKSNLILAALTGSSSADGKAEFSPAVLVDAAGIEPQGSSAMQSNYSATELDMPMIF